MARISGAAAVLGLALLACTPPAPEAEGPPLFMPADQLALLGEGAGDVAVATADGASTPWAALAGRPRLVFFGFTHCPEICPTTIADLSDALTRERAEERIGIDFVSLDPERDTPEAMARYLASFPQVRGVTGEPMAIARLAGAYRAAYRKTPLEGGDYTIDHTTLIYLLDASGAVRDAMRFDAPAEETDARIARLLSLENQAGEGPKT
jgi:protein SCO1/2